ncbi:asparagine synthase (glutamine-hydrolyzing) [Methanobacterium oryzae]|uniref:asparagine synthase (glutamine-hydrolyzing) n=1 Tax=Methanobacterium oryzae TaxID=69540 RepID=UPI003D1E1EB2
MCGICGIIDFNKDLEESKLINMRDTMVHRGPDGAGIYISRDKKVGLGHRRLKIIDLSEKAKQPMSNEDGTLWITFNGEIYNYRDIRRELIDKGHVFKSESDTEVIIHLYEEKGIECVNDLRGMFAFALWDNKKEELYLVRDRIGIKPIYYNYTDDKLFFASEIKAILANSEISRSVNETAFYNYLSFLTTPAPDTLFEGIKKLPGGHWLKLDNKGNLTTKRYWDVFDNIKPSNNDEDKIAKEILNELTEAVETHKISDVPMGVFLSGGIDSSLNATLFSKGEKSPVKTFSIGYKGEYETYTNEFEYARLISNFIGSDHHELEITVNDLLSFIEDMVYYQDEPIADPVCVPVYYVSKLARENEVVVCQVGEGSDELFWGYLDWKEILNMDHRLRYIPNFVKILGLRALELIKRDEHIIYERLRRSKDNQPIFWGGAEAFTEQEKNRILSPRLKDKMANYSSYEVIEEIQMNFLNRGWENTSLSWMSYIDLNLRLPELLLMRVDKMCMAVSLEARVPFLDHKFVERAMSISEKTKTKDKELKYILKRAIRGVIPDKIIDRKKQGFGVPIQEWFFDKLGEESKEIIMEFCEKTDFFDVNAIEKLFQRGEGSKIWYLFNFVLWYNRWIVN